MKYLDIRTRVFPVIFVFACSIFSILFLFFYDFFFKSIDQIFAKQNNEILVNIAQNIETQELAFRRACKVLHISRNVQLKFSTIGEDRVHPTLLHDLQKLLLVWHEKQDNDSYFSGLYLSKNGEPRAAVNFNDNDSSSNNPIGSSANSYEQDISDSQTQPIVPSRLNQEVVQTWPKNTMPRRGSHVISSPDGVLLLRTVFPIADRKTGDPNGFLSIDRLLSSAFNWSGPDDELLLIVDTSSDLLVYDSKNLGNSDRRIGDRHPAFADLVYSVNNVDIPPYARISVDGKELIVTRHAITKLQWDLIHVTYLDPYIGAPKTRGQFLVAGAIIFVFVVGGVVYILTKRVQTRSNDLEIANELVSNHSRLLEQELKTAHDMQMRLMPIENPVVDGFDIVGSCRPATEVGGDFYQYYRLNGSRIAVTLADVTGHGMQAAVPTMVFSGLLDTQIGYTSAPHDLMPRLNNSLHRILEPRTFVCFTVAELDFEYSRVRLSNGGCPYPYIFRADSGTIDEITLSALPLGIRAQSTYTVEEITLNEHDLVVMCSDGIIEATNRVGEILGFERTSDAIRYAGISGYNGTALVDHIFSQVEMFTQGCIQEDDQTMVVIRSNRNSPVVTN